MIRFKLKLKDSVYEQCIRISFIDKEFMDKSYGWVSSIYINVIDYVYD
jgi:hypothetical protein